MKRRPTIVAGNEATHLGRCVVCETPGSSPFDFICGDCGDPLGITLYCRGCGRRLALDEDAARDFLEEHGYRLDDLRGLVLKLDRCGTCMGDDDTVDLSLFRVRIGG